MMRRQFSGPVSWSKPAPPAIPALLTASCKPPDSRGVRRIASATSPKLGTSPAGARAASDEGGLRREDEVHEFLLPQRRPVPGSSPRECACGTTASRSSRTRCGSSAGGMLGVSCTPSTASGGSVSIGANTASKSLGAGPVVATSSKVLRTASGDQDPERDLRTPRGTLRREILAPERGYGPLRRPRLNGAGGCVSSSGSQVYAPTASTAASVACDRPPGSHVSICLLTC